MNVGETASQGIRDEFMRLLVTQLRNQDPLEPVKQHEFLGQLAQFSTLEGIESLNARFEDLLRIQQLTQSRSLIGTTVRYHADPPSESLLEGIIQSVGMDGGRLQLRINGDFVPVDRVANILSVPNEIGREAEEGATSRADALHQNIVNQVRRKLGLD